MDLARYVLPPARAHAVLQAEVHAFLRRPAPAAGTVGYVRHAAAHRSRGVLGKELRRQPAEIHVAIGRDHVVAHGSSLWLPANARLLDHAAPLVALGADVGGEFRGPGAHPLRAVGNEALLQFRP